MSTGGVQAEAEHRGVVVAMALHMVLDEAPPQACRSPELAGGEQLLRLPRHLLRVEH